MTGRRALPRSNPHLPRLLTVPGRLCSGAPAARIQPAAPLPEAAAVPSGLARHPGAHTARAAPGPAESRGSADRSGEQARAPRSTPGSRCSPSGPAPGGPGAGTPTTREPARPRPAPATSRPRASATRGRRATPPARPVGVRLRLRRGSARQWECGALRGAATRTLEADGGEGTRGRGNAGGAAAESPGQAELGGRARKTATARL